MGRGADLIIRIATRGTKLAKSQLQGVGTQGTVLNSQFKMLAKVGIAGLAVAFAGMAKAVFEGLQAFKEFDSKMTQSLAIMKTTVHQQEAMKRAAQEVAMETTISANQSAEAFFFLASAGLDAEQSIAALPQVAKFAQAGMFDMATATDLATDAQSALGLSVDDSQKNLDNLTRVTDVLVKANTLANASVQQFSEALTTKAGAALKVVNKDVEEGVAVLAVFADRGVKGAEAGDKLNQVLRDIPRATAKNKEEFAKLGLEMFDAEGNMKNVADIIEQLDAVLGPMSDELKASTLDQLGLNRGVADAVKILSGSTEQIRMYEEALRNAAGVTGEIADNQLDTLQSELDILNNKWQIFLSNLGEEFEDPAREAVGFLDRILSKVIELQNATDESDLTPYVGQIREVTTNIGGAEVVVKRLVRITRDLSNTHDDERDAVEAYNASLEDLRPTQEEVTQQIEEQNEKEKELAKTRQEQSLGALQNVLSAYQKLQAIQDKIAQLQDTEREKQEKLNKELTKKKGIEAELEKAQQELVKQQELSQQVTLEEELAIIKANNALEQAKEKLDGTRQAEIEYELAKKEVEKATIASTSATRDEEAALRAVEQAEQDLIDQNERVKKAQDEFRESQEKLAKATEENVENLLEMAIAKKELDKAISDANAIGALEEGLNQMVESVGGNLSELAKQFGAIFDLSGGSVTMKSLTEGAKQGVGGQVFPATGGSPVVTDLGGGLQKSSAHNIVTVNVGSALSTPQEIEEVVAKALQEGAKRGINVAF
tara:strand:- start:2177 stop:4495 length:2319 start_codon:yes stop_codon:yes gene_type:complete